MQPARQAGCDRLMPADSGRTILQIVPYSVNETSAAQAFNERMGAARAPSDFLLPDSPGGPADGLPCSVGRTQYVVLDQSGEVRGGFVLLTQPGWLNGDTLSVANYQSPLSEGIHDSRFGMVAL